MNVSMCGEPSFYCARLTDRMEICKLGRVVPDSTLAGSFRPTIPDSSLPAQTQYQRPNENYKKNNSTSFA